MTLHVIVSLSTATLKFLSHIFNFFEKGHFSRRPFVIITYLAKTRLPPFQWTLVTRFLWKIKIESILNTNDLIHKFSNHRKSKAIFLGFQRIMVPSRSGFSNCNGTPFISPSFIQTIIAKTQIETRRLFLTAKIKETLPKS